MHRKIKHVLFLFLAFFSYHVGAAPVTAKGSSNAQEVVLTSEGGMEWDSNKKTLSAENKALAVRGDTALGADKMTAYYHELPNKNNEVFRVSAIGNVIITTPKQIVYADRADYEIEKSVIILKGNPVKLYAGDETMTSEVLELWQDKDMAVAKKNVVATKEARRLEADVVKAFFAEKGSKNEVERFEAENGVTITNDKETVTGDFGVYFVDKETATLKGNVKISQGANYITGEVADINMKTGVSRLQTPADKNNVKGRVRGVFLPDEKRKSKNEEAAASEKAQQGAVEQKERTKQNEESGQEKLLSTSGAS